MSMRVYRRNEKRIWMSIVWEVGGIRAGEGNMNCKGIVSSSGDSCVSSISPYDLRFDKLSLIPLPPYADE